MMDLTYLLSPTAICLHISVQLLGVSAVRGEIRVFYGSVTAFYNCTEWPKGRHYSCNIYLFIHTPAQYIS